MSRFLRRAAFTAAAGGVLYAAAKGIHSGPSPRSGPSSSSSPSTAATGHLALVRAHPDLRDLNALLTPRSFLIDATQALLASVLRCTPCRPLLLRQRLDAVSSQILSAEAKGDAWEANQARLKLALYEARDGRLEDALGDCARVAAEEANNVIAAVLCRMLGRSAEEARWVQGVPDLFSPAKKKETLTVVVSEATLGFDPAAVGSERLVLGTMLGLVEMTMWSIFNDGGPAERLEVLALMLLLRRLVARNVRDGSQDTKPS